MSKLGQNKLESKLHRNGELVTAEGTEREKNRLSGLGDSSYGTLFILPPCITCHTLRSLECALERESALGAQRDSGVAPGATPRREHRTVQRVFGHAQNACLTSHTGHAATPSFHHSSSGVMSERLARR